MLLGIAYTTKRKHRCSILLLEFWRNFRIRTVSQCFSCIFRHTDFSPESRCKNTNKNPIDEKKDKGGLLYYLNFEL